MLLIFNLKMAINETLFKVRTRTRIINTMIELRDVSKIYPVTGEEAVASLKNVTLTFSDAGIVFIVGPSGCGKTTLLNLIAGLDKPTSGVILYDGVDGAELSPHQWDEKRNGAISIVYQDYNLINHLTVLENVRLSKTISGQRKSSKDKALALLKQVGLENKASKYPNQLSGGEKQRVAIARALMSESQVILADEPTGALDTKSGIGVMDLLASFKDSHLIIVVSHNESLAAKYAERVIKLEDGKILSDETIIPAKSPLKESKPHKSFSFLSTLAFQRLWNRKWKSLFLALASSVGLLGMGLVLSLRNGINNITNEVEQEALMGIGAPLSVYSYSIPLSDPLKYNSDAAYPNDHVIHSNSETEAKPVHNNHLSKAYQDFLKTNLPSGTDITTKYATTQNVLTSNTKGYISVHSASNDTSITALIYSFVGQHSAFHQLPASKDKILRFYDVIEGSYPANDNEGFLMVDRYNSLSSTALDNLGFTNPNSDVNISEALGKTYKIIDNDDYYHLNSTTKDVTGRFLKDRSQLESENKDPQKLSEYLTSATQAYFTGNDAALQSSMADINSLFNDNKETRTLKSFSVTSGQTDLSALYNDETKGQSFKIVGILRPKSTTYVTSLLTGLYYSSAIWEKNHASSVNSAIANEYQNHLTYGTSSDPIVVPQGYNIIDNADPLPSGSVEEQVNSIFTCLDTRNAYGTDEGIGAFELYPSSIANKQKCLDIMDAYNDAREEKDRVLYTDIAGPILIAVRSYIGVIEKTLIIFTSLALIVAAIMMGLLTQNSVIEREREIGLYRSMGASRFQVSSLFIEEALTLGLISGITSVVLSYCLLPLVNSIFNGAALGTDLSHFASLPFLQALLIILLALAMNFLGAILPSAFASRKDAALALRSD